MIKEMRLAAWHTVSMCSLMHKFTVLHRLRKKGKLCECVAFVLTVYNHVYQVNLWHCESMIACKECIQWLTLVIGITSDNYLCLYTSYIKFMRHCSFQQVPYHRGRVGTFSFHIHSLNYCACTYICMCNSHHNSQRVKDEMLSHKEQLCAKHEIRYSVQSM